MKQSVEHAATSDSAETAAPIIPQRPEAMDELSQKLFRYNRAQHQAEVARLEEERIAKFKEPVESLTSFVYNIRIEVDPSTFRQGERRFEVTGDLCARTFGEDILTSYSTTVKIPKDAKIEYAAFDGLIDAVADYFPNLVETPESKRTHEIARDVMSVANLLFPSGAGQDEESTDSDETLSQLERDFEHQRDIGDIAEETTEEGMFQI
jgi:hypothetical protein